MKKETLNRIQLSQQEPIYDAHSHIGTDLFFKREGALKDYFSLSQILKIKKANIMSTPSPKYFEDDKLIEALFWEENNKKINYFKKIYEGDEVKIVENPVNPYKQANKKLKEQIHNEKNQDVNLEYVPLVHPKLDTLDHLEEILINNPVAIKIHGIAAGIIPTEISNNFLKTIAKYDVPVIVHTDNYNKSITNPLAYFRKNNNAYDWCNAFRKNNVKGYITHGAYLCEKTFELINESNQFLLGIGPVKLMNLEKEHFIKGTREDSDNYLQTIFDEVDMDKIALDLDFPWNVEDKMTAKEETISKFLVGEDLDEEDRKKVFLKNSELFFNR